MSDGCIKSTLNNANKARKFKNNNFQSEYSEALQGNQKALH